MRKEYSQTIKIYEELGKKYVDDTYKVSPAELPGFINLLKPNSKVLDVGCAGGRDSRYFVKAGHEVIGIDIVDSFLKEARKRVPKAKFVKMDLLKIYFPHAYFDAVWAQAVLLHFSKSDLPKILNKFHKILKPGGILHVRLKRGQGTHLIEEQLIGNKQRLFTFYYKKEVEEAFKKAGFRIIAARLLPDELKRKDVKWVSIWGRKN